MIKANDSELPPHSEQAELMLIACAIELPDKVSELTESLFYLNTMQETLAALAAIRQRDPVERAFELSNRLSRTTFELVMRAKSDLPSAANYSYWRDICAEYRNERERLKLLHEMQHESDTISRCEMAKRLLEISSSLTSDQPALISEWRHEFVDQLEAAYQNGGAVSGYRTGFSKLDANINGIEPKRFYVVGARPNVGKSAFLAQIACKLAHAGIPVLLFSLEMPNTEVYGRLTQIISGVPTNSIRAARADQKQFERFSAGTIAVSKLAIRIDGSRCLDEIISRTDSAARNGTKVMLLDYLQLVSVGAATSKLSRYEIVTRISVAMKDLAMRRNIAIVAAAQLNRGQEKENRKPLLSDLRDSGSIEQDADVVLLLHRGRSPSGEMECNAILDIAKSRNGRCGYIDMIFEPELTRFSEAAVHI